VKQAPRALKTRITRQAHRHHPGQEQAVNFAFGALDLRTLFCCAYTSVYTLRDRGALQFASCCTRLG